MNRTTFSFVFALWLWVFFSDSLWAQQQYQVTWSGNFGTAQFSKPTGTSANFGTQTWATNNVTVVAPQGQTPNVQIHATFTPAQGVAGTALSSIHIKVTNGRTTYNSLYNNRTVNVTVNGAAPGVPLPVRILYARNNQQGAPQLQNGELIGTISVTASITVAGQTHSSPPVQVL